MISEKIYKKWNMMVENLNLILLYMKKRYSLIIGMKTRIKFNIYLGFLLCKSFIRDNDENLDGK
jgi:hypothetical protein